MVPRVLLALFLAFSPRVPAGGAGGGGRSPSKAGGGVASATPPLHRKSQQGQGEDPEMLDLLRNQLEQLAMAKEAEVCCLLLLCCLERIGSQS